jgi:glycosyltransferase involved in cell wall biosynthesis
MTPISVVIIAKNAQETIVECLESLCRFDEVVLYLNNTTDKTVELASTFSNVKIIEGEFIGFGPTKNKAAQYAKNSWILSLDSDEIILDPLFHELDVLTLDNKHTVYSLKRDNYFLGKHIRYSGWGNNRLIRLYNREIHALNTNMVHEYVELNSSSVITIIKAPFKHLAITNINQLLSKTIQYSEIGSNNQKTCSFIIVIAKSLFAFFRTYIFQLGFLDGWRGFIIAVSNFNDRFFRYSKRYINCLKE